MIFISGYENELYNSLLTLKQGWEKKTIETVTKDAKGNSHNRTEVVWMNKQFIKALKSGNVPIKLTEQEIKQYKVNPVRE
jgi:DNA adenine methylase